MRKFVPVLLALAVMAWAPSALAQSTASADITARATVLGPITVTNQADLEFGNVIPGVAKSVAISGTTSGRWLVAGNAGAEVNLDFTALPNNLTGPATMSITYAANDAGHNVTNNAAGAVPFDPAGTALANIGNAPAELYVWIGGTVNPVAGQAAGLYTGTITLQAAYTGN